MSTIEGGMVCTNNKNLNNILRSIRSHGWLRNLEHKEKKKYEKKFNINNFQSLFTFVYSGFNVRPTEINAFLGLNQLKSIKKNSLIRQKNFYNYKKFLKNYFSVNCNTTLLSNFGFTTLVKNRDETYDYLKKKNIETRPVIAGNISNQPYWKKKFKSKKLKYCDVIHKNGIYLPNHPSLSTNDIFVISNIFSKIAKPKFFY